MTSHEVLRTTIKMSGLALVVYGCIQALSTIPLAVESMRVMDMNMPALSYIAAMGGPIIFGLLLWLLPAPIANTVIRNDLDTASIENILPGIETIAIRVMGIFLLYNCISHLVSNYLSYQQASSMNSNLYKFLGSENYSIAYYVIGTETVMAFGLILGAKGIVNLIHKIRYAS